MITAAGLFNLAVGVFHLAFWRLFGWPEKLSALDEVNRAMVPLLNIALTLMFFLVGSTYLFFPGELSSTGLGRYLMAGMIIFWLVRLSAQPIFFGWTTRPSQVFTVILMAGVSVHALALVGSLS